MNMHTFADRSLVFSLKGKNVGQEKFYTRVSHGRHRSFTFYWRLT